MYYVNGRSRSCSLFVSMKTQNNIDRVYEQIFTPFGLWRRVGPRKHVLHGVHMGATPVRLLERHIYSYCGRYRRYRLQQRRIGLLPLELARQPTSAHKKRPGEPKASLHCEEQRQRKLRASDKDHRWKPLR